MQIRDRIKELRRVPASELLPNPKNWRIHPIAQQDALRGVLAEVGYADALIARETPEGLMLVDGHLRAETTPDATVPVLVLDIDEAESDLMLATLDPLAAMAGRDEERLTELLSTVSSDNDTVNALLETLANGYEPLTLLEPDPPDEGFDVDDALDDVEEDDYEPTVQRGEVWSLGRHRLMCGDSTDGEAVGLLMAGENFQCLLTSPPYNVDVVYGVHDDKRTSWDEYGGWLRNVIAAWVQQMDIGGAWVWNIGVSPSTFPFQQGVLLAEFLEFERQLIWRKVGVPVPSSYHMNNSLLARHFTPNYTHELMLIFSRQGFIPSQKTTRTGLLENDVFEVHQTNAGRELDTGRSKAGAQINLDTRKHKAHPANFPILIPQSFMEYLSAQDELTVDPFVGSGTTIIAAERLGRRCYAMEIEPRYCDVAIKRWEDYTGQKAVKD